MIGPYADFTYLIKRQSSVDWVLTGMLIEYQLRCQHLIGMPLVQMMLIFRGLSLVNRYYTHVWPQRATHTQAWIQSGMHQSSYCIVNIYWISCSLLWIPEFDWIYYHYLSTKGKQLHTKLYTTVIFPTCISAHCVQCLKPNTVALSDVTVQ